MRLSIVLCLWVLYTTVKSLPSRSNASKQSRIEWSSCPEVERQIRQAFPGITIPMPFDCGTLAVPLDYTDANSEMLDLTLIRVNATKRPVLGTVLYNPGGPGGSGVEIVAVGSGNLIETLGGQYNIVSWDPRGTGKTIPFDCSAPANADLQRRDIPTLVSTNLTERFLNFGWDQAEIFANYCLTSMNSTGRYLGTAFVARDMLRIIDALGEDGLLRFWGISYGTQLGATFAAMFPERVDRMLLDAVINPHDYQAGHNGNILVDADRTMLAFLEECYKAGDRCDLAKQTSATTAVDLLAEINTALEVLRRNATENVLTWSKYVSFKANIYTSLYFPTSWPTLATSIADLLSGKPPSAVTTNAKPYNLGTDSLYGIRCSDALWQATSANQILDQVKYQASIDSGFADVAYDVPWTCAAWKMKAMEQYKGNFTAKTRSPIMFVGGTFDPVTPLVGAFNSSAGFEGSAVLIHNGYGHTMNAHKSQCSWNAVQRYFKDGILPTTGTICEPDVPDVWEYVDE